MNIKVIHVASPDRVDIGIPCTLYPVSIQLCTALNNLLSLPFRGKHRQPQSGSGQAHREMLRRCDVVQRLHRLNVVLEVLAKVQMELQMRLSCYCLMCVPKRHGVKHILIWMNNLLIAGNCFG